MTQDSAIRSAFFMARWHYPSDHPAHGFIVTVVKPQDAIYRAEGTAMPKKEDLSIGDRVRVVKLRQDPVGEPLPEDIVGLEGSIEWITPGFAGEKSVFEIELDDGRIVNLYAPEFEPVS